MRYVIARLEEYQHEQAYRFYVTRSLQLIPQNGWLTKDYTDVLKPQKIDPRSGEDIAADVMKKAGLHFG